MTPAPAQPDAGTDPDPNALLAAEIEARLAEVEQEIAGDIAGHAEAERVFLIAADAGISAERQWAQEHNPAVLAGINGMLDDAMAACRHPDFLRSQPVPALTAAESVALTREAWTSPLPAWDGSRDGSTA